MKQYFRRNKNLSIDMKRKVDGTLFILPWFIGFLLFAAFPVIGSLYLSLNKVQIKGISVGYKFIGFNNFKYALFTEPDFKNYILMSFTENILIIPVIVIFAFLIAQLLNQKFRAKGLFRTLFFLPVLFTTGFLIDQLLSQNVGDISKTMASSDTSIKLLLTENLSSKWADPIISVIDKFIFILWYSGVQILIFLSGLQSIGKHLYDAAKIDGASAWESFWKITLPCIVPFIFINLIYTITNLFTLEWNPIMSYIHENMFKAETGIGYTSALGWLHFLTISILLLPVFVVFRSRSAKKVK